MSTAPDAILRMAPQDNCAIAIRDLLADEVLHFEGRLLTVQQAVPLGHKVAVATLQAGDKVLRYGAPIGSVTCAVRPGEHLHLHNLRSDYLPTYTLDEEQHFVPASNDSHRP